ncbi:MAG: Nif3-like dinuclear metal center hexameric protein [Tannerellaceae bacterium]|jgi:dinuclear metal center YbgI/SA1388 family protein|nr:Nif3-like dinuclear metal center hexameric protein [Tannerellaceae bacterium]
MNIKDILDEIERHAPLPLQENFDNSGLQYGDASSKATGALLCIDVTEAVIDEAIAKGCNLVISHHPLLFKPLKSLTGKTYVERCLIKACKHDIAVYASHTNLDNTYPEGVSYRLGELIGLDKMSVLSPRPDSLLKLSVFVPSSHAASIRKALFDAGAGQVGKYDSCSFNLKGEGTFRAGDDCHPFRGEIGLTHYEEETRIETILPTFRKDAVVNALLHAHPYEEPAFDIYPLANAWTSAGTGVIGELPESEDADRFLHRLKAALGATCIQYSSSSSSAGNIKKVAICGGSGAFLIPAAIQSKADAFVTGEARYNDFYDTEGKILLAVTGHYESEICTKEIFYNIISKKFPTFALHLSNVDSNPVKYL